MSAFTRARPYRGKCAALPLMFNEPLLSTPPGAGSKAPGWRCGEAVVRFRVGRELLRAILREEVADVEPPATVIVGESHVAVSVVVGGCDPRAGARCVVVAGAPG